MPTKSFELTGDTAADVLDNHKIAIFSYFKLFGLFESAIL